MLIPKTLNRLIGQAMHTYNMLEDGDNILVAVSGGIDSLALAAILKEWQKKAPISYQLSAIHLDMGFGSSEHWTHTKQQLKKIGFDLEIEWTSFGPDALSAEDNKSGCFYCSRNRRTRLFSLARDKKCNKLALGHHKDDIIETFFLNLLYSGNISTMVPNQSLFNDKLHVIRPLAYLEKKQVKILADAFSLVPIDNPCPLAGSSKRESIRKLLNGLYQTNGEIKGNIFAALSNVRDDYLLKQALS